MFLRGKSYENIYAFSSVCPCVISIEIEIKEMSKLIIESANKNMLQKPYFTTREYMASKQKKRRFGKIWGIINSLINRKIAQIPEKNIKQHRLIVNEGDVLVNDGHR